MHLPRTALVATFLAGAASVVALPGCGGDADPKRAADSKADDTSRAAGVPGATGGALAEGAVKRGLPSVVAVSVNSGGITRTGSGTLIAEGTIVTDAKLVTTASGAPAAGVTVREGNGEEHAGVVDGIDKLTGLAALRARDLTAVPIAIASVAPVVLGQEVAGLGFLSARRPAMRPGAVVTTDRAVRADGIAEVGLFEATAALGAQGFGGPVVDARGRVVGITTKALASMIPGTVVALPVGSAKRIAKSLTARGRVPRAYLGVETVGLTPTRAAELRLKTASGVLLRSVVPGSPAAFVALKKPTSTVTIGGREIPAGGDVIVGIDKTRIDEPEDLDRALANRAPGRRIALKIIRGDRAVTVKVTLGER